MSPPFHHVSKPFLCISMLCSAQLFHCFAFHYSAVHLQFDSSPVLTMPLPSYHFLASAIRLFAFSYNAVTVRDGTILHPTTPCLYLANPCSAMPPLICSVLSNAVALRFYALPFSSPALLSNSVPLLIWDMLCPDYSVISFQQNAPFPLFRHWPMPFSSP